MIANHRINVTLRRRALRRLSDGIRPNRKKCDQRQYECNAGTRLHDLFLILEATQIIVLKDFPYCPICGHDVLHFSHLLDCMSSYRDG